MISNEGGKCIFPQKWYFKIMSYCKRTEAFIPSTKNNKTNKKMDNDTS